MTHFWTYEWIAIAYFLYLGGTAALIPSLTPIRRARVISSAFAVIVTIGMVAAIDTQGTRTVRPWLPLLYLVAAYRLPLHLVYGVNDKFERMLVDSELGSLGVPLRTFRMRAPRIVLDCLEFAYLFCYPLIPLGFLTLAAAGRTVFDGDRFWTTVLGATLPCYATLPWLPTRPPRALENGSPRTLSRIGTTNVYVLGKVSVGWNTFPSGHAAASVATALAIGVHMPLAGALFGVVAVGICMGSVTGRYHYTADALAGVVIAVAAFALAHAG
jgi:hypothetical protein